MTFAGFADPARDGARAFRALLDAMARPGVVRALSAPPRPPAPLSAAAAAAALLLADGDAPVWLAPGHDEPAVAAWLRFHAAAPAAAPGLLRLGRWAAMPTPEDAALGDQAYPDRSATLIVEVDALEEGAGRRLTGPGVDGARRLAVAGLDDRFWAARTLNHARFPLGFDVILTAGDRLAALPRTTRADD